MKIDHINISAPLPLLEEVREFYCDVFGLVDSARPGFTRKGYWLYAGDSALVHLMESNLHHASDKQPYLDHVAFRLEGLSALVARLELRQVEYRVSWLAEINLTQLFFKDPAGNGLEANFINEKLEQVPV